MCLYVRELRMDEGQKIQRILRRNTNRVKVRRAQVVLASEQGGGAVNGGPMSIPITFSNTFQGVGEDGLEHDESGAHVANPDRPPALKVRGAGRNRRLAYYYFTAATHNEGELDEHGRCNPAVTKHDPTFYRQLVIDDGRFDHKTGLTVFPRGSSWTIWGKIILPDGTWNGWLVAEGTLANDVTYREFYQ